MKEKLRIGLLIEGESLAAWQMRIVELIQKSNYAEVSALIVNDTATENRSAPKKLIKHSNKIVWRFHEWIDEKLFGTARNPFSRVRLSGELLELPAIKVIPKQTKFCDYLSENDFEKVKSLDLDVAIRFGFRIIKGDFLKIAKYGIWSYHHADNRVNRGTPPGYWEVVKRSNLTGVTLQILQPELDGGIVLCRSWSATHRISITRNKAQIYWKAVQFIPRKLYELYSLGGKAFEVKYQKASIDVYDRELFLVPGNITAFLLLARHLIALLIDAWHRFWFTNQWVLLVNFNSGGSINCRRFKEVKSPRNVFWADPFPYQHNGRNFIFFEEYPYASKIGKLCVVEVDNSGHLLEYWTLLEKPYHLSYPFIFEKDDSLYMIPESGENRTIDLYKCIELPNKWEYQKTIMQDVVAIDTTLIYRDDLWWMFTTLQEEAGASKNEELFIFYAEHFDSTDWKSHPANPVVSDVRSGRMAGSLQEVNNKLYRMAQNGEKGYGGAVAIYEILELSQTNYTEKLHDTIEVNWHNRLFRTHTLNKYGNMVVMDALKKKFRWV